MRLILLTFLGTFLACSTMGQSSNERISFVREKHHFINSQNSKTSQLKSSTTTKQRLDSIFYVSWNQTTSLWVNQNKYKYTYDVNGNSTMLLEYGWNSTTSQWSVGRKTECTFDANGNNILESNYYWDITTNQWVASSKEENTYDTNGNNTLRIRSKWYSTTNLWITDSKNEYTYDTNKHLTLESWYDWNTTSNQWDIFSKYVLTYDANWNRTLESYYDWDTNTSQWVYSSKIECTYNASNNLTLWIEFSWDTTTSQWVAHGKEENTYDSNGNNTLSTSYNWNTTTNQWDTARWKTEYTYNDTYSLNELILPDIEINYFPYNHMLTQEIDYKYVGSSWVSDGKNSLYYSAQNVTGITKNHETDGVRVFPNPFNDFIEMVSPEAICRVTVYDLLGSVVKVANTPIAKVETSSLKSGVYLVKVEDTNGCTTIHRMIKL